MQSSVDRLLSRILVLFILTEAAPAFVGAQDGLEPDLGISYKRLDTGDPRLVNVDKLELHRFEFQLEAFLHEQGQFPGISAEAMQVFVVFGQSDVYKPPVAESSGLVVVVSHDGGSVEIQEWRNPHHLAGLLLPIAAMTSPPFRKRPQPRSPTPPRRVASPTGRPCGAP